MNKMNVGFINLGCSKNLIDTEVIIGEFYKNKYKIVNNEKEAEIIIINTCGFIEPSKEEAINTILEMAEYKNGRCKYLIVTGCLVQRYYEDLIKALPEVDLFLKIDEYDNFWKHITDLIEYDLKNKQLKNINKNKDLPKIPEMPMLKQEEFLNRVITTGKNFAYLKVGEGCSNRCTYCAIPYIRGNFISRTVEDIIEEAKVIEAKGIKEIILIAQDTTKYGFDIYGEGRIVEILKEISKLDGIKWIRLLYLYPEGITDELLEEMANNPKISKYFDIPIQHISNGILKKMNRRTSKEQITDLIKKIKAKMPEAILRTSLIVGFPGETKEQFEELVEFIQFAKFDKLGAFMYSKEEGTPAAKLKEQVHTNTKKARHKKIMMIQQEISRTNLESKIGRKETVIVENISFDKKYYIGRTIGEVPEIDGIVYIKNDDSKRTVDILNNFVEVEIVDVNEYDYIAKFI